MWVITEILYFCIGQQPAIGRRTFIHAERERGWQGGLQPVYGIAQLIAAGFFRIQPVADHDKAVDACVGDGGQLVGLFGLSVCHMSGSKDGDAASDLFGCEG